MLNISVYYISLKFNDFIVINMIINIKNCEETNSKL